MTESAAAGTNSRQQTSRQPAQRPARLSRFAKHAPHAANENKTPAGKSKGQNVNLDLQMPKDLGLDPNWDNHDFSDQEETGCGCGQEKCETEITAI